MRTKFNFFAILCVIAIVVSTVFTSCNKDDDDSGSTDPKDLVGTWKLLSEEWWEKDADGESEHDKETFDADDVFLITFNSNGTYLVDDNGDTTTGTWKTDGNKLIWNRGSYNWTFSVKGKTLTLTYEDTEDGDWEKSVSTLQRQ